MFPSLAAARGKLGARHGVGHELAAVHHLLDARVALEQRGHGHRARQAAAAQNELCVDALALSRRGAVSVDRAYLNNRLMLLRYAGAVLV